MECDINTPVFNNITDLLCETALLRISQHKRMLPYRTMKLMFCLCLQIY